jgi:hypothetical protein
VFFWFFLGGFLLPTLDLGKAAVLVDGDEPDVHELAERLVNFVHLALTVQVHCRQSGNNKQSYLTFNQCCGSGSVGSICFWASGIRIRLRIRILLSSSINIKKNIDSYCFVTYL